MSDTTDRAAAYAELAAVARTRAKGLDTPACMQLVSDLIWDRFGSHTEPGTAHPAGRPYSWIGFYTRPPLDPPANEMNLAACRDKPACSPIGMHGACGQSCLNQRALLIDDVATLGDNYVACDPHDVSEVVVPCFDDKGQCFAVIDGDSFDRVAFDQVDVDGLADLLEAAGLSGPISREPLRL